MKKPNSHQKQRQKAEQRKIVQALKAANAPKPYARKKPVWQIETKRWPAREANLSNGAFSRSRSRSEENASSVKITDDMSGLYPMLAVGMFGGPLYASYDTGASPVESRQYCIDGELAPDNLALPAPDKALQGQVLKPAPKVKMEWANRSGFRLPITVDGQAIGTYGEMQIGHDPAYKKD